MDDVQLLDGNCPSDLPLECDFENADLCGFTNDPAEKHRWTRYRGKRREFLERKPKALLGSFSAGATPGFNSGPSVDHTTMSSSGT